jgi:hypothetical protein|tara:strand:- start:19 stop:237 length:219 start_codon:yes stop_codon:yes gene_type:complete
MKTYKEMVEQKTFAPKQIDKLRKEYGNIGKMTYEQGEKLKNMVSKYPKEVLQQLAKEDIPWISMFAALRLKK